MATKKQIKTMKDHNGFDIPVSVIPKIDLKKDKVTNQMAAKFADMSKRLAELKKWSFEVADEIFTEQCRLYQMDGKVLDNKGNATYYNYDKSVKVEVSVGMKLEFDDRINLAKIEIDEYLKEITEGSNADIVQIVNNAFITVKGKLDHKRLLNLFNFKIEHPRWKKAMELLKDSISSNHSKRYIKVSKRDDKGEYQNINIQFSAL